MRLPWVWKKPLLLRESLVFRSQADTVGEVEKGQKWDNFTYLVIAPSIA